MDTVISKSSIVIGAIVEPAGFRKAQSEINQTRLGMEKLGMSAQEAEAKARAAGVRYGSDMKRWQAANGQVIASQAALNGKIDEGHKRITRNWSQMASKARSTGQSMSLGLTLPLIGIGTFATKTSMDFETTMNQIAAATDAPQEEMEQLSALANKMGQDTVFSANDAAGAILELSKAGMKPAEIQAGGLASTINLAATEGMDLSKAAQITSASMNTFGISADKAQVVVDALAGGSKASTASVEGLGMSLAQAGQQAAASGMDVQETVGALAALAQNGIQASDAGTSLKTFLMSLTPTSAKSKEMMKELGLEFFDSSGKMKSFTAIVKELQTTLGDKSQEERLAILKQLFGSDAARAANVFIKEGVKGMKEYVGATKEVGAAQKMADAFMKGTAGQLEKMKGSIEGAAKALGDALAPVIIFVAGLIEKLADWFSGLSPTMQKVVMVIGLIVAVAGPLLVVIGSIIGAITTITAVIGGLSIAASPMLILLGAIAAAIAVGAAAGYLLYKNWDKLKAAAGAVWGFIKKAISAVVDWFKGAAKRGLLGPLGLLIAHWGILKNVISAVFRWLKGALSDAWRWIKNAVNDVGRWFKELPNKIRTGITNLGNIIFSPFRWAADKIKGVIDSVVSWIEALPGKAADAAKSVASSIGGAINPFDGDVIPGLSQGGLVGPGRGGPRAIVGEGSSEEAVISSEGDRKRNVGLWLYAGKHILKIPGLAAGGIVGRAETAEKTSARMAANYSFRERAFGISGGKTTATELHTLKQLKREILRQEERELRLNRRAIGHIKNEISDKRSAMGYASDGEKEKLSADVQKLQATLQERRSRMTSLPGEIRTLGLDVRDLDRQIKDAKAAERSERDQLAGGTPQDAELKRLETDLSLAALTPSAKDDETLLARKRELLQAKLDFLLAKRGRGSTDRQSVVEEAISSVANELSGMNSGSGGTGGPTFTEQLGTLAGARQELFDRRSNILTRTPNAPVINQTYNFTETPRDPHLFAREYAQAAVFAA